MRHNRHPEEIPTIVSNSEDYSRCPMFKSQHLRNCMWPNEAQGEMLESLPSGNFIVILSWTQLGYVVSISLLPPSFCWLHSSWPSIPSRGFLHSHYAHFICTCSPSARPFWIIFSKTLCLGYTNSSDDELLELFLGRTTFCFINYCHKLDSSKLDFI
jgi:hypothetical protein